MVNHPPVDTFGHRGDVQIKAIVTVYNGFYGRLCETSYSVDSHGVVVAIARRVVLANPNVAQLAVYSYLSRSVDGVDSRPAAQRVVGELVGI